MSAAAIRRYLLAVSFHRYSRAMTILLLAPLLLLLVVAFLYPIGRFLAMSVLDPEPTLAHFRDLLDRPIYLTILIRTFRTGLIVAAGTLVLGYPVAYLLSTLRGLWAAIVAAIVILPLWISVLVRTYVWSVMLGRNGLVNQLALALGLVEEPMKLLNTELAVWIAMIHILLPMMILPIYSSLKAIPPELDFAAQSLGAGPGAIFRHVVFPLSLPGVGAGAVLVFIISLGYFITPMLLGGPRSMLIATMITQQATKFLDWPLAAALSAVLMAVTLLTVVVFNRVLRLDRVMGALMRARPLTPGRLALVLGAGSVLLFLALPTLIVVPVSLSPTEYLDFPPQGLSLKWYVEFFTDEKWIRATVLSLEIGLAVTLVSLVVGTMAALAIVRGLKGGGPLINALVAAPLIVPTIVYAIAILLFFGRLGLSGTFTGFVIAHSALATPYVVLIASAALYRVDPSLELAAIGLGASRAGAIWHVTLPAIRPSLATGGIFAFLTSFDDATVSFFLANLTDVTLPRKMFENLQFFISPVLAVVATLLTVFTLVLVGAAQRLRGRRIG